MIDPTAPASPNRAALAFIFVTVTLDVLAMGIVIPVLPKLVESFVGGDTGRAAEIFGLFNTIWSLMQFVCAPLLGAISDRVGRRPVILVANFGLGLDYILMALAPTLSWLFVGRVVTGITGASFATAGAYIADVSPPEKRAANYGLIGAAFGLGFVLGPAVGGLLGSEDPRLPFWVAAGLTLLNATYGLFVLPESLPPARRASFAWRRANPIGSLKLLSSHPELRGLATVYTLYQLAHHALSSIFVLYGGYRYGWDERVVGLTLAGVGVANIVVQGGLVRPIVARIGDRLALGAGLAFGGLGFAMFGLAESSLAFWCAIPVFAFMGLFGPAAQSLMSRRLGPSEQGQLQGATSSLMGITGLVGPGLFSLTFSAFIGALAGWNLVGAPYLLAALLMGLALALAWRVATPETPTTLAPEPTAR